MLRADTHRISPQRRVDSPAPPKLSWQLKRWAVGVLGVTFLTVVVLWGAGRPPSTDSMSGIKTSLIPSSNNKQDAQLSMLAPVPQAPVGNDSSISSTPLSLILAGTVLGRNAYEGLAFIGINKESPQTYRAGALLANGARIAAIYKDHVAIEKSGRSIDLFLEGIGNRAGARAYEDVLTVGGVEPPPTAVATTHEVLTDYIRPSPIYDGESLRGYQVYAGKKSFVFSQMGLQAGDIITSIDGVSLSEPQSAIAQLQQLTQGVSVTAAVERKGTLQVLSLDGGMIFQDQQQVQSVANDLPLGAPPM